jgi:hypothetical protein
VVQIPPAAEERAPSTNIKRSLAHFIVLKMSRSVAPGFFMKTHLPVRINDIAAATGLSRATIDRVMNKGLNNIIVFREEPCS